MAESPPQTGADAEAAEQQSAVWRRAAVAMSVIAAVATVTPVVAHFAMGREAEAPRAHESQQKEQAAKPEAEQEEEETPARASTASSWMPFSGGGGGGHASSNTASSADLQECNRAADAARRRAAGRKHPGLGKALDNAGGSLLGATAQSLHGVELQTDDDARAAEAYAACVAGR